MQLQTRSDQEMVPLTDSLSSRIRWRYGDYEAMLRAEVDLMLSGPDADSPERADADREEA
jgi:hypothetical protein